MAKKIMFQGTSSNVGKSILCTALCRIFYRKGFKTVPFKAQNMALNSYVTKWGDEIGRAQVAQAEAASIDPIVQMNPVLLKPTGNQSSQVVLMGKPVGVYSAKEYHTKYSLTALDKVKESIDFLDSNFDMMVIEGAGSPAEVNLKANDIVNMRIAKMTQAPVYLIADIDRGGAIASIVGTLELLEPEEVFELEVVLFFCAFCASCCFLAAAAAAAASCFFFSSSCRFFSSSAARAISSLICFSSASRAWLFFSSVSTSTFSFSFSRSIVSLASVVSE